MSQSNNKGMEKQPTSGVIFNNGMQVLMQRHPEIRNGYIQGVTDYLKKIPGAKIYARHQIARVVNDEVGVNYQNRVIKTAFLAMYYDLYPDERPTSAVSDELLAA